MNDEEGLVKLSVLKNYQESQNNILYNNGMYHSTHDMHVDLDDMWRGCLNCKTGDGKAEGIRKLKRPCGSTPKSW